MKKKSIKEFIYTLKLFSIFILFVSLCYIPFKQLFFC